jgi:hypothetical protein
MTGRAARNRVVAGRSSTSMPVVTVVGSTPATFDRCQEFTTVSGTRLRLGLSDPSKNFSRALKTPAGSLITDDGNRRRLTVPSQVATPRPAY